MFKTCYIYLFLFLIFSSCKRDDEKQFLITKIRSASKLATAEVVVTKLVSGDLKDRGIKSWFRDINDKVIFNTEATVKYGVDLKKLRNQDISIKGDSIHIFLPPVEILNFSYPHEKYEQLYPISQFDKINNRDKIEIMDDYFRQAEIDIRKKLTLFKLDAEIETKTRIFLESFFQKFQFYNVVIEFKKEGDE